MADVDSIQIETKESLLEHMQEKELTVEWTVYSDVGPDWIGSHRTMCFYLDEYPLHDNSFHDRLRQSVIKLVNIPETSEDNVIQGEGEIVEKNGRLYLTYWWSSAPPYQDSVESGNGEGELQMLKVTGNTAI